MTWHQFYLRVQTPVKCLTLPLQTKSTYLSKIELNYTPSGVKVHVQGVLWPASDNWCTVTVLQTRTLNQHLWWAMNRYNSVQATTEILFFQNPQHWRITLQKHTQNSQEIRIIEHIKSSNLYKITKTLSNPSQDMPPGHSGQIGHNARPHTIPHVDNLTQHIFGCII